MEKQHRFDVLDPRPAYRRHHWLLGLWLRSAFAGAALAVAGLAALVDSSQDTPFLAALTWVAAGGTLVWVAWQRARAVLDRTDSAAPNTDPALMLRRLTRLPGSY